MYFATATILSALAAVASAVTPPTGEPNGNPIGHPGLNELIPAGTTYNITWTPTTQGDISILLLRGPSTNVVPILTIADSVPNTGSYSWNVPTSLQPDTTNYGVELIVEGSGQYQYSPQCGVQNPYYNAAAASSATSNVLANITATITSGSSTAVITSAVILGNMTFTASYSAANGTGSISSPILSPTKSMTVPSSLSAAPSTTVIVLTPSLGSATATFSAGGPSSSASSGAVVKNAQNFGAMAAVGLLGALAL